MKNPCRPLEAPYKGLSVTYDTSSISIVVETKVLEPILLPKEQDINIRFLPNTQAHVFGTGSNINLVLERDCEAYWYGASLPKLNFLAQVFENACLNIAQVNLASSDTNMQVELKALHAQINFIGLDQISAHAVNNTRLHIIHEKPHTKSTQAFRGIYAGESLGSFIGKVSVAPFAEQSSVQQLYKSVLLSEQAHAFVKPELEIDNYNISASHGASIGQLDEEALFYLCSRGLSLASARALLVKSMTAEILQNIHPCLRDFLSLKAEQALESLL